MAEVSKKIRDEIVRQALEEIQFARRYKDGRIVSWHDNESMYYGKKQATDSSRANVELGKMQGFVHTILSKIDSPLLFRYIKGSEADLKPAKRINSLREQDAALGDWDMKDLLGKKQSVIYGRAVYSYFAESKPYRSNLTNIDVYDFLIDPAAGGFDLEQGMYMGDYGVVRMREELRKGAREGKYLKYEVNTLLSGDGNADDITEEETDKDNRYLQFSTTRMREIHNKDKFKFWNWCTTYDGERYYLLLSETNGVAIRVIPFSEMFSKNKITGMYEFPYWTWAAFPDLTEFWTPSYCDYVREIFKAQNVSINQMLDNAEEYNKPQRAVDVTKIKSLSFVKYKKDGIIPMRNVEDINRSLQILRPPAIDTPIRVYEALDTIQQIESGVTAASKGIAEEEKVGIYEGNQANVADRFALLNKSYTFGYKRFARLYHRGIKDHLTQKVAIQIIGIDGIQIEEITKKDIDPYQEYNIVVQASNAENQSNLIDKRNKIVFLDKYRGAEGINARVLFEIEADIVGISLDDVKRLTDIDNNSNAEVMSEAARDIERVLDGEKLQPNEIADAAYLQKFVDYMRDNKEHMSDETFNDFLRYLESLRPIIIRNMTSRAFNEAAKVQAAGVSPTGEPLQPTVPEAVEQPPVGVVAGTLPEQL